MARECSVCGHAARHQIDRALIEGRSARDAAASFGLNFQSVNRHRQNHLPAAIRRAAREAMEGAENAPPDARGAPDLPNPAESADAHQRAPQTEREASIVASTDNASPVPSPVRQRRRGMELGEAPAVPGSGATVSQNAPSTFPAAASVTPVRAPAPATLFNSYEEAVGLRSRALAILAQAERDGDMKTALTAIREARGVLEHLSRLEERNQSAGPAVPLAQSPEWHRTRSAVIAALADHPEARLAVAEALVSTGSLQ